MPDLSPTDQMTHLAALADVDPEAMRDYEYELDQAITYGDTEMPELRCKAVGPTGGECCRDGGHLDGAYPMRVHVTFANDRYEDWPVGWRPAGERIKAILDPSFGRHVSGTPDYVAGFHAALTLVRDTLATQGR
jgi:hypothetical protein